MTEPPRPIRPDDTAAIAAFLGEQWHSPIIHLDGQAIDASTLPGFVAHDEGAIVGLVTLLDDESGTEIVTLNAIPGGSGLGSALVELAAERSRSMGGRRLAVRTSNDNLDALRFYQRRGFRLERVVPGAIDEERLHNPSIPRVGRYGIALRDELTLVRPIDDANAKGEP